MFFTKGGLCSLQRGVGRSYVQLKKAIYNLKKLKEKLCTIGKIKTKKLKRLCTIPKVKN